MNFRTNAAALITCTISPTTVSLRSFSTSLKQPENVKVKWPILLNSNALNGNEKVSKEEQRSTYTSSILNGSSPSPTDCSLLQCMRKRRLSWESPPKQVGTVLKSFLLRSNLSNEDSKLRSSGSPSSNRLQSLNINVFRHDKFDKKFRATHLVGADHKENTTLNKECSCKHSASGNTWSFVKSAQDGGATCIPLPSAFSSKLCRHPNSSGNFFNFEQPATVRI